MLVNIGYNEQPLTGYQQKKLDSQMEQLRIDINDVIDIYANSTSKEFVGSVDNYTKKRTEIALEEAFSIKPTIYTSERTKGVLEGAINQNVNLIKGLADDVLKNINTIVHEATVNGNGVQDIYNNLQTQHHLVERRAKLIAYDQTRKITSQLGNQRARDAGAEEFEWLHSGKDAHPRRLHQLLNGKIFRYDDPPVIQEKPRIKGLPSQLINCKCQAIPVFRLDKEEPKRDIRREYKRHSEKVRAMRTDYHGMSKQEEGRTRDIAEELYDKYGVQVEAVNKVESLGKNIAGEYFKDRNEISIASEVFNRTSLSPDEKNQAIREYKDKIKELEREIAEYRGKLDIGGPVANFYNRQIANREKLIQGYKESIQSIRNKPTKEMKASRELVGTEFEDIVKHEYGHALDLIDEGNWSSVLSMYEVAKRKGDLSKISKYGASNPQELFAEAFVAYERGEKIPKYMIEVIEKLNKRNKK